MNEPVRVLSDLHLGHKISRIRSVSSLRPLIRGAGTVILNGDTWQELAKPFYEKSKSMLQELEALCREEGVEAVFLPGNHDPGWPGPGWVELAGGRIVITHGDGLLFDSSPWKREILVNRQRVEEIWAEEPDAPRHPGARLKVARKVARELCSVEYPTGRNILQRTWDAITPPRRAFMMIQSWFTQGARGAEFCDTYFPKAEMLLIGHFHFEGNWSRAGKRIINTGSFMPPGRAHWIEWKDGWLSRGWITGKDGDLQKGRILDTWRFH